MDSSNVPALETGPSKEVARAGEDGAAASSAVAAGGFGAGRARRMQSQPGVSRQAIGASNGLTLTDVKGCFSLAAPFPHSHTNLNLAQHMC